MKRILTVSTLIVALSVMVCAEGGITGKWQGKTMNGTEIALDLTVTKAALTGTFTRRELTVPIAEGKVSKNTFTFKATMNNQTEGFSGELAGDELKVWLDRQGRESAALLKRAKD